MDGAGLPDTQAQATSGMGPLNFAQPMGPWILVVEEPMLLQ